MMAKKANKNLKKAIRLKSISQKKMSVFVSQELNKLLSLGEKKVADLIAANKLNKVPKDFNKVVVVDEDTYVNLESMIYQVKVSNPLATDVQSNIMRACITNIIGDIPDD